MESHRPLWVNHYQKKYKLTEMMHPHIEGEKIKMEMKRKKCTMKQTLNLLHKITILQAWSTSFMEENIMK